MDRDGVIAFLVTALGAICVALLALGPVLYVLRNGGNSFTGNGSGGVEAVAASIKADADASDARAQEIEKTGLSQRYTVIPFHRTLANALYRNRDFATVEAALDERYSRRADPYEAHLYTRLLNLITRFEGNPPPDQMAQAIDAWVASRPESYRALLVRALFHMRLGLEYREAGANSILPSAAWKRFEEEFSSARADLEAASLLNTSDAEIPVNRASVAMYMREGRQRIDQFYDEAISLNPACLSARVGRSMAAAPTWGGSWTQVDDVIAECETASEEFPLLLTAKREAEQWMWSRSKAYAALIKSREKRLEWVEPYLNQLKRNPNDPMLIANVAYFAGNAGDFVLADQHFRMLGDNFPEGTNCKDLLEYNNRRGYACAVVANSKIGTPEARPLAEEALAIAPDHYYTNHVYGTLLFIEEDYAGSLPYFEKASTVGPKYLWSQIRLAEVADKLGQKAEAIQRAKNLLTLELDADQQKRVQAVIDRNN